MDKKYLDSTGLAYFWLKINNAIQANAQIQSDWNQTTTTAKDYIKNKPDLSVYAQSANLASVATSGSYNDLSNKPTIPEADVALTTSELDEAWGTVFGVTISFTIGSVTYQAEEGMTWEEWIASNYNIDGFMFDKKGGIFTSNGNAYVTDGGTDVDKRDIIIEDHVYSLNTGRI